MTDVELSAEKAIGRTLMVLVGLVLVLFVVGAIFRDEVVAGSVAFVETFGPMGVALGFFIPDATALPLPHDVFLAAGRLGGLSFGTIVVWASTGSILGGCTAYGVARMLAGTDWFEKRSGKKVQQARALFEKYGAAALALSAVSPLPYSLLAWASGGLGLSPGRFFGISLLRILRVAGYLWAIDLGFVQGIQP